MLWANDQPHVVASGLWIERHTVGPARSSLVAPVSEHGRHRSGAV